MFKLWFWLSKETFGGQFWLNTYIIRTQRPFHFSHDNFDAILKMLAHLSASISTSKSNHYSLIGHGILLSKFHKYCMIYRLSMFEKLKNIMRDTVCRRFLHHIVLSYYIWDNVCRTFMHHIVVSYYIKATDVKINGNPFCSKLLHFAYRCQCSCKAKCSNYYILQRYYILGCDRG